MRRELYTKKHPPHEYWNVYVWTGVPRRRTTRWCYSEEKAVEIADAARKADSDCKITVVHRKEQGYDMV